MLLATVMPCAHVCAKHLNVDNPLPNAKRNAHPPCKQIPCQIIAVYVLRVGVTENGKAAKTGFATTLLSSALRHSRDHEVT